MIANTTTPQTIPAGLIKADERPKPAAGPLPPWQPPTPRNRDYLAPRWRGLGVFGCFNLLVGYCDFKAMDVYLYNYLFNRIGEGMDHLDCTFRGLGETLGMDKATVKKTIMRLVTARLINVGIGRARSQITCIILLDIPDAVIQFVNDKLAEIKKREEEKFGVKNHLKEKKVEVKNHPKQDGFEVKNHPKNDKFGVKNRRCTYEVEERGEGKEVDSGSAAPTSPSSQQGASPPAPPTPAPGGLTIDNKANDHPGSNGQATTTGSARDDQPTSPTIRTLVIPDGITSFADHPEWPSILDDAQGGQTIIFCGAGIETMELAKPQGMPPNRYIDGGDFDSCILSEAYASKIIGSRLEAIVGDFGALEHTGEALAANLLKVAGILILANPCSRGQPKKLDALTALIGKRQQKQLGNLILTMHKAPQMASMLNDNPRLIHSKLDFYQLTKGK